MSLLTQRDREYILAQLTLAPDSVLADAMLAFDAIRTKIVAVRKMVETPTLSVAIEVPIAKAVPPEEIEPVIRSNVSPGKPAITKIGSETKASILGGLANNGIQPSAKFAEHCKLLWSRGEIKFDGKEYYL